MKIQDGSGKGYEAKVDNENRLHTDSVSRDQSLQAALKSNSYNISTGVITLTSGDESGVFYIKNNEDNPLVIKEILVIPGATTGGSGNALITIKKNPSAGTLISGASAVSTNVNRDFGSAKSLTADVYKGAEGNTVTDGSNFAASSRDTFDSPITFDASIIVLRKGNSLAVTFEPPTGNTSQTVIVACTCFIETADVNGN